MTDFVLTRLAVDDLEAASGFVSGRVIDWVFEIIDPEDGPSRSVVAARPFRLWMVDSSFLRVYHCASEPIEQ